MTVWKEKEKSNYKCSECGAKDQYTLTMKRFVEYIYDGPYSLPIGEDNQGCIVQAFCSVCGDELDIDIDDFNRLYTPKKGIIFYNNVSTEK